MAVSLRNPVVTPGQAMIHTRLSPDGFDR